MDFRDSESHAALRAEARAFLDAHAPDPYEMYGDDPLNASNIEAHRAWQKTQHAHGWAGLTWPEAFGGRGLGPIEQIIFNQECARRELGLTMFMPGLCMVGPTIIAHGTEEQKQRYLGPLLAGDEVWCQLFSEPSAGSDLAGIGCRAERDGDTWVINGQKTWSSGAADSDYGILLCRTDPTVPKHEGITYFLLPMDTPGIEVRPIRQMNDGDHFADTFLNDVRIPDSCRLGEVNGGWACAMTTLMNERIGMGGMESFRFDDLAALVRERRDRIDPVTRDRIVKVWGWGKTLELLNARIVTKLGMGVMPDAESSVMKLAIARLMSEAADMGLRVLGPEALGRQGTWQNQFLFAPAMHVAGGTDEIQKNVAAERTLGMPKEPRTDRGVAFEDLPRG
ncbi:MAG: acyl-CoA dehydrogenase family protein [Deltaproteobacteria bacterium]|nr:acyl-CoA dehydrogenase family protein [Deltaproteobacteria bacterium]MBW2447394.1 acyl-CoA dehydrogenase family protein [Deltaproteobacteria bacterium]